jgi:aminopeptidase N
MRQLILGLACLHLGACDVDVVADRQSTLRFPAPTTCLPACEGSRGYDALHYRLAGRFDWDERRLIAAESITLAEGAPRIVELDAVVDVKSVTGIFGPLPFVHDGEKLRVDLGPVRWLPLPPTFVVGYEASPSVSLLAPLPADDDPVRSRVVLTHSEPDRARRWLVSNDRPSDRATFGVELVVEADEDVLSNGRRLHDLVVGPTRLVGYAIDQPIPTYLMAFAAGELEHVDRPSASVPLSVWYRRGFLVDAERNLDVMASTMAAIEALIGPYPFDRYSVAFLPGIPGMENATVTFNAEQSAQGVPSASLHAHEMAHQWFGDWVTMHDYDDAWIKEGMATLLTAQVLTRDDQHRGRRNGRDFFFRAQDAIVDPTLTGLDKYTTGPYGRAAWLMTQLRERVGEEAFWAGARRVLADHPLGTIDAEGFFRAFGPALDDATREAMIASLTAFQVPVIDVHTEYVDTGTVVELTVSDEGQVLFVPFSVTIVDGAGVAQVIPLAEGETTSFVVPYDGYLALDEADLHPDWGDVFLTPDAMFELSWMFMPYTPEAIAAFLDRSAGHQETANRWHGGFPTDVTGASSYYAGLDSSDARYYASIFACDYLRSASEEEQPLWREVVLPILRDPPLLIYSTAYRRCGVSIAEEAFGEELAAMAGPLDPTQLARLEYLLGFDHGHPKTIQAITALHEWAGSLKVRNRLVQRASTQAQGGGYTPVPADDQPLWVDYFRARLGSITSATRFVLVSNALFALRDFSSFAALASLLHSVPLTGAQQRTAVCRAYLFSGGNQAWTAFQDAAQPWETLDPAAASVLSDPSTCP